VTDDGPGIPAASIDRIFELFYRDPSSSRLVAGSGIGLFVCASLAEAMGGRIWAARPPGGGTEIGFTLRILEPDADDTGQLSVRTQRSRGVAGPVGASEDPVAGPAEVDGQGVASHKVGSALGEGTTPAG
jgi:hypothetical protein